MAGNPYHGKDGKFSSGPAGSVAAGGGKRKMHPDITKRLADKHKFGAVTKTTPGATSASMKAHILSQHRREADKRHRFAADTDKMLKSKKPPAKHDPYGHATSGASVPMPGFGKRYTY